MIKIGEFRPFRQYVELYKADLETKYISGYTPLMESVLLQNEIFVNYEFKMSKTRYFDYKQQIISIKINSEFKF